MSDSNDVRTLRISVGLTPGCLKVNISRIFAVTPRPTSSYVVIKH